MARTTTTLTAADGTVTTTITDSPQDSVEFGVSASGKIVWNVKAYANDAAEMDQRLTALRQVVAKHEAEAKGA